ncbi:AmmeMemoRadiSam system protein B [uncultured Shewanella sp.]|uniref:AmmeMemoRadiSam system protein B n=1 Tax=uncultured Shewanella sp. TaxID=173975 RepID=UPI00261E4781|nr:AmmeMemoRadiSam system protein B [uncultured Shewanella sp.]
MFGSIRPAAVANLFYPGDPDELRRMLETYLTQATSCLAQSNLTEQISTHHFLQPQGNGQGSIKVIVVPHAGYIYSGQVAAHAYALIQPLANTIKRVVLIGPAHTVYLHGAALPQSRYFATPLGQIGIDSDSVDMLASQQLISVSDLPHQHEHCLEVQLPFLQHCLKEFKLIPLLIGESEPYAMAELLECLWGGQETLIVVSTDLSHFHQYDEAVRLDKITCLKILDGQGTFSPEQACGSSSLNALFPLLKRHKLCLTQLNYQNSGDTAGDKNRVVGYASFASR